MDKILVPLRVYKKGNYFYLYGDDYRFREEVKRAGFRLSWIKERFYVREKFKDRIERLPSGGLLAKEVDEEERRKLVKKKFPFLYDFQIDAVLFGWYRDLMLLDDMGLGKTVTALAIKEMVAEDLPCLIITPKTVQYQWEKEIREKFNRKVKIINGCNNYFSEEFSIISYGKILFDYLKIPFPSSYFLICDECSKFKNHKTKIYEAISYVSSLATRKIFLTGTPIENRMEDFLSIITLLNPRILDPTNFRSRFTFLGFPSNWDRLVEILYTFSIRRRKEEVLDQLPELIEENRFIESTTEQKEIIEKIKDRVKREKNPFGSIQLLRLVVDDLRLLKESESDILRELYSYRFEDLENPKIEELETILEESQGKVIVFTQFAKMARILVDRFGGFILTGETRDRERIIEEFRKSKIRTLFCSDVLSYGMNLQFVDYLINFDLPWNPAVLNQRIARVYRIGSKNKKFVVNLINKDIEKKVFEVIKGKINLFDMVVNGKAIEEVSIRDEIVRKILS